MVAAQDTCCSRLTECHVCSSEDKTLLCWASCMPLCGRATCRQFRTVCRPGPWNCPERVLCRVVRFRQQHISQPASSINALPFPSAVLTLPLLLQFRATLPSFSLYFTARSQPCRSRIGTESSFAPRLPATGSPKRVPPLDPRRRNVRATLKSDVVSVSFAQLSRV